MVMGRHKWSLMLFCKGTEQAKKSMQPVSLAETIPHPGFTNFDGGKVLLRPAREGTGIIAGGGVRAVLEGAGIKIFIKITWL